MRFGGHLGHKGCRLTTSAPAPRCPWLWRRSRPSPTTDLDARLHDGHDDLAGARRRGDRRTPCARRHRGALPAALGHLSSSRSSRRSSPISSAFHHVFPAVLVGLGVDACIVRFRSSRLATRWSAGRCSRSRRRFRYWPSSWPWPRCGSPSTSRSPSSRRRSRPTWTRWLPNLAGTVSPHGPVSR